MIETTRGRIREIDTSEQEVWKYVVPVDSAGPVVQGTVLEDRQNNTFRTWRYGPDYPGFEGRDLTPGAPIELDPVPVLLSNFNAVAQDRGVLLSWFTSYEDMHDGFNVYRSRVLGGEYARLNDGLVREYKYLDRTVDQSTTYYYRLGDVDRYGRETLHSPIMVATPAWRFRTALSLASPNPFRESTTIDFSLAAPSEAKLAIYDVAGRMVRVLVQQELPVGEHTATWDARDGSGLRVAAGTYFAKFTAGDVTQSRKVVVLGSR
jgi:hypothetical protein